MDPTAESAQTALDELWRRLNETGAVMLGTGSPEMPFRPMRPFASRDERAVWFYGQRSTGLFAEVGAGTMAHLVSMDASTYADVIGRIEPTVSRTHVDRYWTATVAAMFEKGKDDPDLVLFRFTPQRGWLWSAAGDVLTFTLEMAMAGLIGDVPGATTPPTEVKF